MDDGSISYSIVSHVADQRGVEPEELRPLHDVIDPDALESLFDDANGSMLRDGHVAFSYEGFIVRVHDDLSIDLTDVDAAANT